MKTKILLLTAISTALIFQNTFAQSITASLGVGTFVQGISTVNNLITAIEPSGTADSVRFYATDPTYATEYDTYLDITAGDGFEWSIDMGILPPSATVWAEFFDNTGASLGYSNDLSLNIISTPSWITNGGSPTNVTVSGNTIELDAELPILSSSPNPMPNDLPGLSSRPYDLLNSNVKIHIQYDYTQPASSSTLTNPSANFDLNVFNQITIPYH